MRGWVVDLLPFIEGEPLRKAYHYDQHFYAAVNQPVVSTAAAGHAVPVKPRPEPSPPAHATAA